MTSIGDLKDTYEFLGKLGEGSGGVVYKAYHKRLRKNVVLKKIKTKNLSMEINRKEVDMLKNLSHTYLPQVLDFLEIENDLYTVMDYIPGESFSQALKKGTVFGENELIRWGMQLCSALYYLHSQKPPIIHCDVKPGNIMLMPDGDICLIDFNISFCLYDNAIIGYSNGYSSPELFEYASSSAKNKIILNKEAYINEKTDIYSLGATLYHLATQRKISKNLEEDIQFLKTKTSEEFAAILKKALQRNPQDRYATAYAMFSALENITKSNNQYIQLLKKQNRLQKIRILGLAFSICLGGFSIYLLHQEKTDQYFQLVDEQISYREDGDYVQAEEVFEEASDLVSSNLQTYYQNAYSLYSQAKYEECIEFIENRIFGNDYINEDQENIENTYYLLADSYFQQKKYQKAIEVYKDLFKLENLQALYYRDYAITLAYAQQNEMADDILDKAIEEGLTEDSIYYAKAEIANASNDKEAAIENMNKSIGLSDDNELKKHAYVQLSEYYKEQNDYEKAKITLDTATSDLPVSDQIQILESLAQINIDIANKTQDSSIRNEAIDNLKQIIDQGWDSYQTYDNLAIQYEKLGEYEDCRSILQTMSKNYGEDYNLYKRYAFLEAEVQNQYSNQTRDYTLFKEYYQKAKNMYSAQNDIDDMEMNVLEQTYADVIKGGW